MLTKAFADQFLGFLESQETDLLSWGFYDFCYDHEEVEEFLSTSAPDELKEQIGRLESDGYSVANILEELAFHNLLHRVQPNTPKYRTRLAEGVRLIARLRQVFRSSQWSSGPTLVSDIKVDLRHRLIPVRPFSADECWLHLVSSCTDLPLQHKVFLTLATRADGKALTFARFQQDSFRRILSHYRKPGLTGTVITAGTGAGKTKAFYIPAFLGVAPETRQDPFTKVIAIYPRNVLLADQLREAIAEALKIQDLLKKTTGRGLVFGALLGTTLWSAQFDSEKAVEYGWKRQRDGYVVPFLKSPISPEKDLVWRDDDRKARRTCLYHSDPGDEPVVPDGLIILTRDRLRQTPPDVLFVSAEMLNRLMGDPSWDRTLGIGQGDRAPRLLLLDEVHAHEGLKGTQIAWVIRRWLYWSKTRNLHTVALSATLREPDDHLSKLAGISRSQIAEYRPQPQDLYPEGHEYNLAVKGDATSGTSLLATSIQTAMVLGRLLTPRTGIRTANGFSAHDLYGSKVFGFSDNLDSVNRWFFDVRSAEVDLRLARFRLNPVEQRPRQPDVGQKVIHEMRVTGQLWELPRNLGYDLNQPLWVTRCTSQDVGAESNSDIIVATSSLEVGYDDPEVGAVLHHKHPKTLSSFIQRKGRGGRRVGTHPWTVTVLSDYGTDRFFFQNAERLFDPFIDHIFLPILNPYVLRIQASYFLLDWIGRQISDGEPFRYLAFPSPWNKRAQTKALRLLTSLLEQKSDWNRFRRDFLQAFAHRYGRSDLSLSNPEAESILWDEPRPLMLQVIPSLARKLESNWTFADPSRVGTLEDAGARTPIPEFLPYATFGDVGSASVRILTGAQRSNSGEAEENEDEAPTGFMPIQTALFELCPGRVSKRFSKERSDPAFWLKNSDKLLEQNVASIRIHELYPGSLLVNQVGEIPVFQPTSAELVSRPIDVADSSNSSWSWRTYISPVGEGLSLSIFENSDWADIIENASVYLHRDRSALDITRYAESLTFETLYRRGRSVYGKRVLGYQDDSGSFRPEAIGFRQSVDGLRVRLSSQHLAQPPSLHPGILGRFRSHYFLHRIRTSEVLQSKVNYFAAERLWQTSVSMLIATALKNKCTLPDAQAKLGNRAAAARKVLDKMSPTADFDGDSTSKVATRIAALWNDTEISAEVVELEKLLWGPLPEHFHRWVKERYVSTLGEALRSAAASLVAELSEEDFALDVKISDEGITEIFISELNSGGLGHIDAIVREMRRRPAILHEAIRNAIEFCERDDFATNLGFVLRGALSDANGDVADAFENVRAAVSFRQSVVARTGLQSALRDNGVSPTRGTTVGIMAKLLKPGSSRSTDLLTYFINRAQEKYSSALGIGIDPRVFAYACLNYHPVKRRLGMVLSVIGRGADVGEHQLYAALEQFAIIDCKDSCTECLTPLNRFAQPAPPSRELAHRWLSFGDAEVEACSDWLPIARASLHGHSRVKIVCDDTQLPSVSSVLQRILSEEVEVDYLLVPIAIARVDRKGPRWIITLQVGEGIGA